MCNTLLVMTLYHFILLLLIKFHQLIVSNKKYFKRISMSVKEKESVRVQKKSPRIQNMMTFQRKEAYCYE